MEMKCALRAVCLLVFLVVLGAIWIERDWLWQHRYSIAKLAPIATAAVASGAACIAIWSLYTQRKIAQRRATIDFFVKTDLDQHTINAFQSYRRGVDVLKTSVSTKGFAKTSAYKDIRFYLNIHEVLAVGIRDKIFDSDLAFNYWSGELKRAHKDCEQVIEHAKEVDWPGTYYELTELHRRWKNKEGRWARSSIKRKIRDWLEVE
jgi:hypothetical protein